MQEPDYLRMLNRLRVHFETTKDMISLSHGENDHYYQGKLAGLSEALTTMTGRDHVSSRQEQDCPFCHVDNRGFVTPLIDTEGITLTIKPGEGVMVLESPLGTLLIPIWRCAGCGARVKLFPDEKELPEK